MKSIRVSIIGAGAMGRWFAEFAKKNIGDVSIYDVDAKKAKKNATELGIKLMKSLDDAKDADVAIVSVPTANTPAVLRDLSRILNDGALLMDIASAKSEVMKVMRKIGTEIETVSLHPLFGPGTTSVDGKDFIAIPVNPGKRYGDFKRLLTRLGARVTEMDEEEHDKTMATIQCLTHFLLISYIAALGEMDDLKEAEKIRTPIFDALFNSAKAILAGNPDLYSEIQIYNKYAKLARSKLLEACKSIDQAFDRRDYKKIRKTFAEAVNLLGEPEIKTAYRRLYKYFEEG